EFDLEQSQHKGHGIELAAKAVKEGYKTIVAAGGDGTLGDVINGMMEGVGDGKMPKFGVMPMGTGNDLVANLGLPSDLDGAAKVIATGITKDLDLCQVNDRYFINNAGIGLEPYTTTVQENIKSIHGILRYVIALLISILKNPQWTMHLEWEDGEYHGPVTLVSISNGARTGGVFYTVPHADLFDGKLTFTFGYIKTRLGILKVLPKILKPEEGNISEHPVITEKDTRWLKVRIEEGSPAHTDGELISYNIHELSYQILPGKVPVIVGE
ncbi:MAG: YegS/Rv2252/BmrU family lipid kinase, partial [Chloroflexi bacterium]|nr:YegS/Rv2252/BmrU family lipid kinase [Chloroflexota bacterium]